MKQRLGLGQLPAAILRWEHDKRELQIISGIQLHELNWKETRGVELTTRRARRIADDVVAWLFIDGL